jgi:RNA polymerase sigma-70 factor (ECF subfamily)
VLQGWIDRMNAGDPAARDQLIKHASKRLRTLTRRMLRHFRRVRRWEDTDDVLQNAVVRLLRALRAAPPESVASFFRLATCQVRRELLDLARHYYGPRGPGTRHHSDPPAAAEGATPAPAEPSDSTNDPARLAQWTELHAAVEGLPADERDVFELVWYQGLAHAEAAAVLGVAEVTVRRRWLSARLGLRDVLGGLGLQA